MRFETFFKLISYAAVFCGFLSLWVSGTFGLIATGLFVGVMAAAWYFEGSRWQISERLGTVLIVAALPAFYLAWRYQFIQPTGGDTWIAGVLARMILCLSAVKLLQRKTDRDWIFLYLMSFFEVLLGAGLSISALYLASFLAYLLVMVCTVVAFEIKKTSNAVDHRMSVASGGNEPAGKRILPARRLPATSIVLIAFIGLLAAPMFFMLPRMGGAGLGSDTGGVSTSAGFADTVRLGGIGRIQQNDEVVMRVRVDKTDLDAPQMRWRGIALDTFDNRAWSKSRAHSRQPYTKDERDLIQLDFATGNESLSRQTVYLEPLDTSVLFGLPRVVAVQGNFPVLFRDLDGAITVPRTGERVSYRVISDRSLPAAARLNSDNGPYSMDDASYLQLPQKFDQRIEDLARQITASSSTRFQKARALESYLQNNFGYTLELKAGGNEPLADFLFNVREGHCEYFATAMAVMLRTQGIATRVVNGFQQGDYNDAADVFVVRQRHAHSWVEVYFPKEKVWYPFDPTPFAGRSSGPNSGGILAGMKQYIEALETFWIQYFVAFDDQEQQSLVRSLKKGVADLQTGTSSWIDRTGTALADWWAEVRGDRGMQASIVAIGYGLGYSIALLLTAIASIWLIKRLKTWGVWSKLRKLFDRKRGRSAIEFYDRMLRALAGRGLIRHPYQTPLEFAHISNIPAAVNITEKYNRVRFGERALSKDEETQIAAWIGEIEKGI